MLYKKHLVVIATIAIVITTLSMSFKTKKPRLSEAVALVGQIYVSDIHRFDSSLREYPKFFFDSSQAVRLAKYNELIGWFKKMEWLYVYLHSKEAYQTFLRPFQFQKHDSIKSVLPDNWLFNGPIGLDPDSFLQKLPPQIKANQQRNISRMVTVFIKALGEIDYSKDVASLSAPDIFEALRLQLMKISTVDISNGNFTVVEDPAMHSLRSVFSSWAETAGIFLEQLPPSEKNLKEKFSTLLKSANQLLAEQKDQFKKFDRVEFLTEYLLPLSSYLYALRTSLQVEPKNKFAAVSADARNLFEPDVFNVDFFAPSEKSYLAKAKVELGKFLFFDPILSDNNKRACASCHKPEKAFTDGLVKSVNFDMGDLPRNSPTVMNSAFQKQVFWDLRATSLEDQLDSVINNANELHSSFEHVIDRINSSKEYKKLFNEAFPETKTTGIQREHVKIAIACYERTLNGFNSRFDQFIRGDKTKLTADEINGLNIFLGKGRCATCHIPPLFNGTIPPFFELTDHKAIGIPLKDTMEVMQLDIDTGASRTFQNPLFKFSFKTPTVRNIELTAPYMHNGVYKTLPQVVNFYNHAGGQKFLLQVKEERAKIPYPFFPIIPDTLGLNEKEKNDLVAFMKTLTDIAAVQNVPTRLPQLTGKYAGLNARRIGGEY
jgi:cytochrome c peroxidase